MISLIMTAALVPLLALLLWCCCELAGAWMDAIEHPARPAGYVQSLRQDAQRAEDIRRLARALARRDMERRRRL